jgi:enolase
MRIDRVEAKTIPDTRGRPTIETTLSMQQGSTLNPNSQGRTLLHATASVPSGESTGEHEAVALDAAQAVEHVNGEIAAALGDRDFASLDELDTFLIKLDGTPDKLRLGANAILSVSIAAQRLSALQKGIPLWQSIAERADTTPSAPRLFVNVMNGGVHANFRLPFQEYILIVEGKTSVALPMAQKAFEELGQKLGAGVHMGDEGGYSPTFDTLEKPFELLADIVSEYPETGIALDAAASEFYKDGMYTLLGKQYSTEDLVRTYENLVANFPLVSIEDPFHQNAYDEFIEFTAAADERILVVGDDLTCTNPKRVTEAIGRREVNAVLIKPNQVGTVMETIKAVQETRAAGFKAIASHRSGETADSFIADFAYGIGAYGLKAGGLGQPERLAKYNRLLAIEREVDTTP